MVKYTFVMYLKHALWEKYDENNKKKIYMYLYIYISHKNDYLVKDAVWREINAP